MLPMQANLGRTDAEILKMGRGAWLDYYSARTGAEDSTARALTTYAGVLGRRNDRLLKARPKADRERILAIRTEMRTIVGALAEVLPLTTYKQAGPINVKTDIIGPGLLANVEEWTESLIRPDPNASYGGQTKTSAIMEMLNAHARRGGPAVAEPIERARASLRQLAVVLKKSSAKESEEVITHLWSAAYIE